MAIKTTSATTERDGSQDAPYLLKQGRTFALVVCVRRNGSAVDLSSPARTGRSQLRKLASDIGPAVAAFSVTIRNQTTDRGKADVTLGATASQATNNPPIAPGLYQADVEFVNDGDPDDVLASDVFFVEVTPEVTK